MINNVTTQEITYLLVDSSYYSTVPEITKTSVKFHWQNSNVCLWIIELLRFLNIKQFPNIILLANQQLLMWRHCTSLSSLYIEIIKQLIFIFIFHIYLIYFRICVMVYFITVLKAKSENQVQIPVCLFYIHLRANIIEKDMNLSFLPTGMGWEIWFDSCNSIVERKSSLLLEDLQWS